MSTELFEFNRVTFAFPVQQFKVTAFISTEERLPAVTEFVLRLLHTCGHVSLTSFRDYFGFSEAEALSVIESLDTRGYVKMEEDTLALSEQMVARFEASADDFPWITKQKKRTDVVAFDLLAFTALRRVDMPYPQDNWVKINPDVASVGESVARAKRSYRENFALIERESSRSRNEERERSFGVHSIEEVEVRRTTFVPVTLSLSLNQAGQYTNRLPDEFESSARPALMSAFRERIGDAIESASTNDTSGIADFADLFELDFLRPYVTGSLFDLARYATDVRRGLKAPSGIQAVFGSLYLKHNLESVTARVHEARELKKAAQAGYTSLAWLAPDYAFWGRGEDFRRAIDSLHKALQTGDTGDSLYLFDYAQEKQESSVRAKYLGTGASELHLFRPDGPASIPFFGSLELMLYPGRFASAMFHIPLPTSPGVRVAVGMVSENLRHLQLVHKLLLERGLGNRYAGRMSLRKQEQRSQAVSVFPKACSFLNFSDLGPRSA